MLYLPDLNIDWPRSNTAQPFLGRLRTTVDDFQVNEVLNIDFTEAGEHLYLQVEKTNLNTEDVRCTLAQHYEVPTVDVSYSGMKDKRAIARQWFSIRLPSTTCEPSYKGFRVLQAHRHHCKLRRGTHTQNEFRIVIRDVKREMANLNEVLTSPFPNYFGTQRFGLYFNNLTRARKWVEAGKPRIPRTVRARYLSTLRSYLFNELLGLRVKQENWKVKLAGDPSVDDRATGPLWGRGTLGSNAVTAEFDQSVQTKHPQVCEALEWVGLQQERRPLSVRAKNIKIEQTQSTVTLEFSLPVGSYATVGLSEYFDCEVDSG